MRKLFVVIYTMAGLSGLMSFAIAQTETPDVHETRSPESAQWSVKFSYAADLGVSHPTAPIDDGDRIAISQSTRTGDVKFEKSTFSGGSIVQTWVKGTLAVVNDPPYPHMIVRLKAEEAADFPEFAWINESNHVGREKIDGRECDIYNGSFHALRFSDPGYYEEAINSDLGPVDLGPKVAVTAYVDAEQRLPVLLRVAQDTREYKFEAPPSAPLSIPAEYGDALQKVGKRIQAIVKPLAKP